MNVEIRIEAEQFPEKEYINGIFLAVQCTYFWNCCLYNKNCLYDAAFLFSLSYVVSHTVDRPKKNLHFPVSVSFWTNFFLSLGSFFFNVRILSLPNSIHSKHLLFLCLTVYNYMLKWPNWTFAFFLCLKSIQTKGYLLSWPNNKRHPYTNLKISVSDRFGTSTSKKFLEKPWFFKVWRLLNKLITLKAHASVPTVFVGILKAIEEKSRIRIRNPEVWIRGSESVSKRYGSGTLLKRSTFNHLRVIVMKGYTDCEEKKKRWLTDGMTKPRTIPTWYVQIEPWILLSHPELTGIKNPSHRNSRAHSQ